MKTNILFVDDEQMVLSGLQRMLRPMRGEWDMAFANSGAEALQLADKLDFDVVVSDMRMPGMNGAQVLNEMMARHPKTIRFILSGYADKELIMQCTTSAHQFLSKPCDAEVLVASIKRVIRVDAQLKNPILKSLAGRLTVLPSLPRIYAELTSALEPSKGSPEVIGHLIEQDPAMTAKILQLVNSAFFGLQHRVTNPVEAVGFLGFETVKALVLWVHIFGHFDGSEPEGFSFEKLSRHSMLTGLLARDIALSKTGDDKVAEEAFTSGLLHDIGKLILATNLPEPYLRIRSQALRSSTPLWKVERDFLGADHGEIGSYLIGLWGLPFPIVEAVGFHHKPSACGNQAFGALTAVHLADAVVHEVQHDETEISLALDPDYVEAMLLVPSLDDWRAKFRSTLTLNPERVSA